MGVEPIEMQALAFALGATFSGLLAPSMRSSSRVNTPGAFEFNVSIKMLCV
jgi:ABC-type branched-subunit amino acid transport system permease subunit